MNSKFSKYIVVQNPSSNLYLVWDILKSNELGFVAEKGNIVYNGKIKHLNQTTWLYRDTENIFVIDEKFFLDGWKIQIGEK